MSDVVYRPGEWQVVVEESGVAALPADASADKVVALSAMLSRGVPSLTEVIDVLSGGAITGLGSFAVALIDAGGTRFAVRGAVRVSTGYQEGFSGEDITTWSERFIADEPRFEIAFGDAGDAPEYPIRSGVVLASGVRVGEPFDAPEATPAEENATVPAADAVVPDDADAGAAAEEDSAEEPAADDQQPTPQAGAESESDDGSAPDAEAAPEPEPDSEADAPAPAPEPEAAPEPETQPQPGTEPEAEAEPALSAADGVQTETITPDEVLLARSGSPASAAESDLSETIVPPVRSDAPASDSSADAGLTIPPPPPAPVAWSAPVAAPESAPLDSASTSGLDIGDHDGATISLAEARRLRRAASAPDAPTEVIPTFPGEGSGSGGARIRLSTGQSVDLDRPVIIGRKPRSTRASGSTLPHLIAVDSPQSDISRNHLEVRPEGDSIVVIDLHTTNGSTLLRPGSEPVRLHPGEQTLVLDGDVIDLGDGVTVAVEEPR